MKHYKKITLLFFAIAPILSLSAKDKINGDIVKLDADKDGKISTQEAQADPKMVRKFSKYDKDGDGFITNEEMNSKKKKGSGQASATSKAETAETAVAETAVADTAETPEEGKKKKKKKKKKDSAE